MTPILDGLNPAKFLEEFRQTASHLLSHLRAGVIYRGTGIIALL
jgi:hypothetical protein